MLAAIVSNDNRKPLEFRGSLIEIILSETYAN
ncbi:hypothetical protein N39L_47290 [Limnospira platensis NIES-39]|uniref:Uncharacterized protein n=2 Tax=Limnospira TaxID=2596745 RepID=B5VWP1_LIMMA|nr:hypothetical protein AmaxDRAFT_0933 [Limnospira maxima CS-328]UWU47289.1 hypothetical protein APLC1_2042 [Arthrospira platensis C1]BDT15006.1 hypothetical protein N39L_47290 [Arthrospira platensis NIES-39]GCE93430.1 hypothetical protein NIES46_14800 [Arthrospira platensis NIES-46]